MSNSVHGLSLEQETEKTCSIIFHGVNQGQIGRGSVVGVGLSSTAKSPSGSDQIPLLYQMESSSDNVRRLPAQNCHLLLFKVYSKDEKLYGSGERADSKYKTSNPFSVNQWLRSYYFYHVFLLF